MPQNWNLTSKKYLFINMNHYYKKRGENPFDGLPMTFHVKSILDDEWTHFRMYYENQDTDKNIWIVKPGENSSCGHGIQVTDDLHKILELACDMTRASKNSCIIQKYITNPLLISGRKFDIRTYMLLTSINGNLKAYYYEEGYLRTSSHEFSLGNLSNNLVHLTNDAV
jgi:hypothetical protein